MGTKNESNLLRGSKAVSETINRALNEGRTALFEYEANQVAKYYGISTPKGALAVSEIEAVDIATKLGFPLVMKIVSPDILHKTEAGGVMLGIDSISRTRECFREIVRNARRLKRSAVIKGVYLQKLAEKSVEFVVGGLNDREFGPTVMFGLGGIYVELYKDVSFRLAPVSDYDIRQMMSEIRAAPLLTGFRKSASLDVHSVAFVIRQIGQMIVDLQNVSSVDINPLLVYRKGCKAVDVRIVLSRKEECV